MNWALRTATAAVFGLLAVAFYASVHGWGLRSDADTIARNKGGSARAGSIHSRRYYGGGPRYGK